MTTKLQPIKYRLIERLIERCQTQSRFLSFVINMVTQLVQFVYFIISNIFFVTMVNLIHLSQVHIRHFVKILENKYTTHCYLYCVRVNCIKKSFVILYVVKNNMIFKIIICEFCFPWFSRSEHEYVFSGWHSVVQIKVDYFPIR